MLRNEVLPPVLHPHSGCLLHERLEWARRLVRLREEFCRRPADGYPTLAWITLRKYDPERAACVPPKLAHESGELLRGHEKENEPARRIIIDLKGQ
jgi:hypothetical protein